MTTVISRNAAKRTVSTEEAKIAPVGWTRKRSVPSRPLWARFVRAYEANAPNHRGKKSLLHMLIASRRDKFFAWPMKNGAWLAISPDEGLLLTESVGWTCFMGGVWEPHVERCLRELLSEGDVAIDVGANLGYFSAVMAQSVGERGRIWSFEPVPSVYERLALCRELNGFTNMTALPLALGAEEGTIELSYDPRLTGNASVYPRAAPSSPSRSVAEIRTLDGLVKAGVVEPPDLLKVDVEGHELDVLTGARETIAAKRPAIVFELNQRTSSLAGWQLADVERLLTNCGDYRLYRVGDDRLSPVEREVALERDRYVDLLALDRGGVR